MRQVLLLRGVNLGRHRRIAMPALRATLAAAGYTQAQTFLASGNAVVESDLEPQALADEAGKLISEEFGFPVEVVVRTATELEDVVAGEPLGKASSDPKLYHVNFYSRQPPTELVHQLAQLANNGEQVAARQRELYVWLPGGAGRSKLWASLARPRAGLLATARNWRTVTGLLELARA